MKAISQDEHNKLIAKGDYSRVKRCGFCGTFIDDAQEYCSDECQVKHEQENIPN